MIASRTTNGAGTTWSCSAMLMGLAALGSLGWCTAALAEGHRWDYHTRLTQKFFSTAPLGKIAIISGKELRSTDAYELTMLPRTDYIEGFKDREKCRGVISHREPSLAGRASYFGLQILYIYDVNPAGNAVFVQRNGGWASRKTGAPLKEMPVPEEVNVRTATKFADGHATISDVEKLNIALGRLVDVWHAKIPAGADTIDKSGLEYWHGDPTSDAFAALYRQHVAANSIVRVENRLLRFDVTDAQDPRQIPNPVDFAFYCGGFDGHLRAVLLRVYAPLSSQADSSYVIVFK